MPVLRRVKKREKNKSKADLKVVSSTLPTTKQFTAKSDNAIVEEFLRNVPEFETIEDAIHATCKNLEVGPKRVRDVMRKAYLREHAKEQRQEIYKEVYKDKIPIVEDIVGLSLSSLKEYLLNLQEHKELLFTLSPKDATSLAAMAIKLNEMLRLELGKSTQNVAVQVETRHSLSLTVSALEKLKAIDPVFEYGDLPALDVTDELS